MYRWNRRAPRTGYTTPIESALSTFPTRKGSCGDGANVSTRLLSSVHLSERNPSFHFDSSLLATWTRRDQITQTHELKKFMKININIVLQLETGSSSAIKFSDRVLFVSRFDTFRLLETSTCNELTNPFRFLLHSLPHTQYVEIRLGKP